ncbi:hypothetical protein [Methylobacter sp.]|uniref:hypothetical protein n=1 Tax=Methylobacter sp. TaxID=2051955 RepID=UPI002FDDCB2A
MPDPDPIYHVRKMYSRLEGAAEHLRRDADGVDEPLFKVMFESAALVLDQLVEAFRTYERESGNASGKSS